MAGVAGEAQNYFDDRSLRVVTNPAYLVTPGDVYLLTFNRGQASVSQTLIVEADSTVNMSIFGTVNVKNLTFLMFKRLVEEKVIKAYPNSHPLVMIRSTGVFEIYIKGEVNEAGYKLAWGLTRLSEIVRDNLTQYSSIRNIQIISSNGRSKKYDLFHASRSGAKEQDPFVRPEDTIIVSEYNRQVTISGEIERPGIYQLLSGEQLNDVLSNYGNGSTSKADLSRVELNHYNLSEKMEEIKYLDLTKGFGYGTYLSNGDTIFVPSKTELLPIVHFQGAIVTENSNPQERYVIYQQKHKIRKGETLYTALRSIEISPQADLSACYIIRKKEKTFINLDDYLYNYNPDKEIVLQPLDRIVIPYSR